MKNFFLIFFNDIVYVICHNKIIRALMTLLHCGRNGRLKSERINALRKQYDNFLEEDRKRKERNEYILGRLDKMRICDKLVVRSKDPVSFQVDHPVISDNRSSRNDYELLPFRRNYSVEPPQRTVDEVDLLRIISKNYILIPRRDQRSHDHREFTTEKKISGHDNDWESKYDILNRLKNEEKLPNDQDRQITEIDTLERNSKKNTNYGTIGKENERHPEIPERDLAINDIGKFRNSEEYPVYKDILKEQLAIKENKDTDNAYHTAKDDSFGKETVNEPMQQPEPEMLIQVSRNMRRPQIYTKPDAVDENLKEDDLENSETNALQINTPKIFVESVDQIGAEVENPKEIINQEYPLSEEDQEFATEVENIEDFSRSDKAPVQPDTKVNSTDYVTVNDNNVQQQYFQEQEQYTPESTVLIDSQHEAEILPQNFSYSQETNENYQELDKHSSAENYNTTQVDNAYNYDQSEQEVTFDKHAQDINYEQNIEDSNYEPNMQDLNCDQQILSAQNVKYDQVLNYEQTPEDVAYDQSAQNINYDQTSQDATYEGHPQNYTNDPTFAESENYPNQQVGDPNFAVDGVYHPDTSYVTDPVYPDGVDQNYANVQNQPVTYDHDITEQQYDQTYAEQYSTEEQVAYEQPQQYQPEYDQVYEQYEQNEQNVVEGVQKQLDAEDGYIEVEQNPPGQENVADLLPEEPTTVTT